MGSFGAGTGDTEATGAVINVATLDSAVIAPAADASA